MRQVPRTTWAVLALLFFMIPGRVLAQHAASPDSSGTSTTAKAFVVTLKDGRTYDVIMVRPFLSQQMIEIGLVSGGHEYIPANRVKRISSADGTDLTHRVMSEGRHIGPEWTAAEPHTLARRGTVEFGSSISLLNPRATGSAFFLGVHAGVFASRHLEFQPSASALAADLTILEVEVSALLHGPGAPGRAHPYARFAEGAFLVTPGEPWAPEFSAAIGFAAPSGRHMWTHAEVGLTHISSGHDISGGTYPLVRVGFSALI